MRDYICVCVECGKFVVEMKIGHRIDYIPIILCPKCYYTFCKYADRYAEEVKE